VQIDYRWGAGDRGQLLPSRQRDDQVTMNSRRRAPGERAEEARTVADELTDPDSKRRPPCGRHN